MTKVMQRLKIILIMFFCFFLVALFGGLFWPVFNKIKITALFRTRGNFKLNFCILVFIIFIVLIKIQRQKYNIQCWAAESPNACMLRGELSSL